MANRPKQKGTYRESLVRDQAVSKGLPAQRFENGGEGRDVDVRADMLRVLEVKDRQNLNVHKILAKTIARWPESPPAVVWHRTSKADGNVRATPDGPTIMALPLPDGLDLLAVARQATAVVDAEAHGDDRSRTTAIGALADALREIRRKYPNPYQ